MLLFLFLVLASFVVVVVVVPPNFKRMPSAYFDLRVTLSSLMAPVSVVFLAQPSCRLLRVYALCPLSEQNNECHC